MPQNPFHVEPSVGAIVHADETGHKEQGRTQWMWVAIAGVVSVFLARAARSAEAAPEFMLTTKVRVVQDVLLPLFGLALITLGGWLAYADRVSSAATCFTVGILVLLIANLDRIESFKGFGLEAKTRDLKQTISEAEQIKIELEKMRQDVTALSKDLNTKLAEAAMQMEALEEKSKFAQAMASQFAHQNFGGL